MSDDSAQHGDLLFLLRQAGQLLRARALRSVRGRGIRLTPEQWGLLGVVAQDGGMTQAALARKTHRDAAALTRLIDVLENQGMLERLPSRVDRRANVIHLTSLGKAMHAALAEGMMGAMDIDGGSFTRDQTEQLRELLVKFCASLRKQDDDRALLQ